MSFSGAQGLAQKRAGSSNTKTSMFLRMLWRAAVLRRGRAASALLAMIVAAAAATAMLNLYVDVQAKLRREFRNYGANVLVLGKDGQALPASTWQTVNSQLAGKGIAVPFSYVVARTSDGRALVVSGTDFELARKLNPWWNVTDWPTGPKQALVGSRAAAVTNPKSDGFTLSFQGRSIKLKQAGIVNTGAAEDSRIYLSAAEFKAWTGVQPSTIEIAAAGSTQDVSALVQKLADVLPGVEVRPLRQVLEGEARVLGKTRSMLLAAAVLIILTAALCVLSTLMGWVLDRRKDFAIMKALGASERMIGGFLAAEAATLGLIGAVLGYALGVGIAAWIGRANFHAPVGIRWSVLPPILAGSVMVALLSAWVPISLLRRVQPAMILRGE